MDKNSTPKIVSLYRYPVKGLSPQPLENAALSPGQTIRGDRIYAIENGPGRFDPDQPRHLPKINFLMLMRHERLAALQTHYDDATETLTILRDGKQVARGALNSKLGRQLIEQFFVGYMKKELKGPPKIVSAEGHSFSDVAEKCLHLVNLETVRALESVVGTPVDPLRFRANVYFDGVKPWEELKWVGQQLRIGDAKLQVFAKTQRCDATNVNPSTAERDMAIPPTLMRTYNHMDFGIYAQILEGGQISPGATIEIDG